MKLNNANKLKQSTTIKNYLKFIHKSSHIAQRTKKGTDKTILDISFDIILLSCQQKYIRYNSR